MTAIVRHGLGEPAFFAGRPVSRPLACMDAGCMTPSPTTMRRPGKKEATDRVVLTMRYILRSARSTMSLVIISFLHCRGQQSWKRTRPLYILFFYFLIVIIRVWLIIEEMKSYIYTYCSILPLRHCPQLGRGDRGKRCMDKIHKKLSIVNTWYDHETRGIVVAPAHTYVCSAPPHIAPRFTFVQAKDWSKDLGSEKIIDSTLRTNNFFWS